MKIKHILIFERFVKVIDNGLAGIGKIKDVNTPLDKAGIKPENVISMQFTQQGGMHVFYKDNEAGKGDK